MKQYQITFYPLHKENQSSIYYREFENKKQAQEWADTFTADNYYTSFSIIQIPLYVFLENQ